MLSHITVGTNDLDRAISFYGPVMSALGLIRRDRDEKGVRRWAYWGPHGGGRPFFIVMAPLDGRPASFGNGSMVALAAASRTKVDEAFHVAIEAGGSDEGAPGARPQYHPRFYGAYVRDPDGNKLCFCNHDG